MPSHRPFLRPFVLLSLALAAQACAPANYARSAYGTEGGYSFRNATPKPASLLVARKIERPLYIVLDPARVRDVAPIATAACETESPGCERFSVLDVHTFVRRDLKRAMEAYFTQVEVVAPGQPVPAGPAVVAEVKVDSLRLRPLVRGPLTYQLIEMTWGFALRRSEDADFSYSFAGTATSGDSYRTFEAGLGQLVEDAIPSMLKKWTESGGIEALRRKGAEASTATRG
jgi:hypothetical protein